MTSWWGDSSDALKAAYIAGAATVTAALIGAAVALAKAPDQTSTATKGNQAPPSAAPYPAPSGQEALPPEPSLHESQSQFAAKTVYLSDLSITDDSRLAEPGQAVLAGKPYVHSVVLDPSNWDEKAWASIDLGGHYTKLKAMVGMPSGNTDKKPIAWEVFGNGQSLKKGVVGLYKPTSIEVNVRGIQRLMIQASLTSDFNPGGSDTLELAFGDATLSIDATNPPILSTGS